MGTSVSKPKNQLLESSASTIQHKQHHAQNYLLIWVDANIDPTDNDCKHTLTQLHLVVSEVKNYRTIKECVEFLNEIDDQKAFIISSGALGKALMCEIHDKAHVDTIYIFCHDQAVHEGWIKQWSKIQGIFTHIEPICDSLKTVARECDHDAMPMSFVSENMITQATAIQQNCNQLKPSFMYSVLFKEILLEINEDDEEAVKDLLAYCLQQRIAESELKYFENEYNHRCPIKWYTCEIFLYSMLNKALRSMDTEAMSKMGFFIRNLHRQLEQLHKEQKNTHKETFIVYRGQGLSQQDLQHLQATKGGLLSFNNFLSTSRKKEVAMVFVQRTLRKYKDQMALLFVMTIDPNKQSASTTPFAVLNHYSCEPQEEEILFTMDTVFRVNGIEHAVNNNRLWEVELSLTDENDPQLKSLTQRMREEIDGKGWYRMAQLMLKMGHFSPAENIFNQLLKKSSEHANQAYIHDMLGILKNHQGKYQEAISYYKKSLEIKRATVSKDDPILVNTYNNLGLTYKSIGCFTEALDYYNEARQILEKTLPSNHPDLATLYNNIGVVYSEIGNYSEALTVLDKHFNITRTNLPENHPNLAASYTNIGLVHDNMGDYSKALENFKKCTRYRQKSSASESSLFSCIVQ